MHDEDMVQKGAREFWQDLKAEFGEENVRRGIHDEVVFTLKKVYLKDGWLDRLVTKLTTVEGK